MGDEEGLFQQPGFIGDLLGATEEELNEHAPADVLVDRLSALTEPMLAAIETQYGIFSQLRANQEGHLGGLPPSMAEWMREISETEPLWREYVGNESLFDYVRQERSPEV